MKNYLCSIGLFTLILLLSQSFLSPIMGQAPANDNCEYVTPTVLTNGTSATFTGTTVGATANENETNIFGRAVVWQAVTLTGEYNNLTVDFCGTPPGNMTRAYRSYTTSCPVTERFNSQNYDNTTCSDGNITYRFEYLPAGTYYLPVIVDASNNTLGEYTMNVLSEDSPAAALANDNCITVTPTVLTNGTLVSFTGTTVGATASENELNYYGVPVVWEAVTLTECSTLTVNFCGTPEGNMTSVINSYVKNCSFDGEGYANVDTGICSDGNATYTFKYLPAGTYYLPVVADEQDYGNTLGEYKMNVLAVTCPPPPPNDNCADITPTVLTNGTTVTFNGTTEMQTSTPEEENLFYRGVVWEAVTLTGQLNNLKVDFCGTGGQYKPQIYYTKSCSATEMVQPHRRNSNECSDGNQTGYFYNLPAGTYYIPVDLPQTDDNPTGAYTMTVLSEDVLPAPANDNCEDVTPTTMTNGTHVTFTGTTVGATTSPSESALYGNSRTMVWEAVTLTGECQTLTIGYCGTDPATNQGLNGVITKSCTATAAERIFSSKADFSSCSDGKVTYYWYNLPAGTYYLPVITSLSETPGAYKMTVLSEDCPVPPPNDNCADVTPTVLTNGTPITFTGNNANATATPAETTLFGGSVVWEAVTLTGNCNNLTFDFCGTDNTIMNEAIMLKGYLTSCSSTSFITGETDRITPNCPIIQGSATTVRFYDLPAGTYYIPVFAKPRSAGPLGEYRMNVLSEDCPPVPENNDCENAIPVACGDSVTGTTKGASNSGGNPARDVFYTYKGNGTEESVTLSLQGSDYDTFIRVYSDCTLTQQIANNDNFNNNQWSQVNFTSNGTSTYVIMVEGAGSAFGNFKMKVACETTEIPANDNCGNAIALSCGETKTGSTSFATDSGGNSTPDVFYSYTGNGTPELVTVSLCGSLYNTYLRVFKDCTLTNEIAANITSASCTGKSELSFVSDGISTYIIMVEGKIYPPALAKGIYEISLTCEAAPEPLTCATTFIPSTNVKDAMTLGHVGSFGTQYAVDIPVGDTGYAIEGFVPTVLSASSYFNFIFFEDNGGTPGAELFTRAGTIESSENLGTLFSVPVLKYRVKFDKVVLQPNKTYWIQIDCNSMGWAYTEMEPMRLGYADVAYNFTGDVWESVESQNQLAFELICSEDDMGVSDVNYSSVSYYPNPVDDILNISSKLKIESLSVFNAAGQKAAKDFKVINGQINVSSLTSGVYVLKAVLEGGKIETFKIIKK